MLMRNDGNSGIVNPSVRPATTGAVILPAAPAPRLIPQSRRIEIAERQRATRHVALLIESSGSYGRGLIQGVARYNREHAANWSIYCRPPGLGDEPPNWLAQWSGDGILARIGSKATADVLAKTRMPVVNLRGTIPDLPFPYVTADNAQ